MLLCGALASHEMAVSQSVSAAAALRRGWRAASKAERRTRHSSSLGTTLVCLCCGRVCVLLPACNFLIIKDGGDHQMMCGCEAAPAGGTMAKALAGGGCGHKFSWDTLQVPPMLEAHPRLFKALGHRSVLGI